MRGESHLGSRCNRFEEELKPLRRFSRLEKALTLKERWSEGLDKRACVVSGY